MITNFQRSIDESRQLVEHPAPDQSDEVTQALSRFLVVRTCGFLERVTIECSAAYVRSKSSPRVAAYGASWLEGGRNPSPDHLIELVGRFDSAWGSELRALLDDDDQRLRREISFLIDRRNKVAHGMAEGINARKALDLLAITLEVTDWFIRRLDPR